MRILLIAITLLTISGCDNPYFNPDISKATTELKQLEQLKEQNSYYERIATALEKIAEDK